LMDGESNLYLEAFQVAAANACGWSAHSLSLLRNHGLLDWPQWLEAEGGHYRDYRNYVTDVLLDRAATEWQTEAAKHSAQVPYLTFQAEPSNLLADIKRLGLSWQQLLQVRSWCRFRAGLIRLRHQNYKPSEAKSQCCIFCNTLVRNATTHTLGKCAFWSASRDSLRTALSKYCGCFARRVDQRHFFSCVRGATISYSHWILLTRLTGRLLTSGSQPESALRDQRLVKTFSDMSNMFVHCCGLACCCCCCRCCCCLRLCRCCCPVVVVVLVVARLSLRCGFD